VRRARPLRWQFAVLCLGLLVPTLAFVGVLLWQFAASERTRAEQEALALARRLAVTLDREINGVLTTLQGLATSPSLQSRDLPAFYAQMMEVQRLQGINISLRGVDGGTSLTTRAPLGTTFPMPARLAEADREVLRTGAATVSGVFTSSVTGLPVFQIVAAPVAVGGSPAYLLAASLDLDYLVEAIRQEDLPPGWIGVLVDRDGVVAVRTERQVDFAGKPASPDLRAHVGAEAGTYYGRSSAGQDILAGHARSKLTGWTASASVGAEIVAAPRRLSLLILAALGIGLGLIAALVAVLIGRRMDRAVRAIGAAAAEIGRGGAVAAPVTRIVEMNRVGAALAAAAVQLRAREAERDRAEAALRDLNAALEDRVAARTRELEASNRALIAEMQSREAAEGQLRQLQKMEAVGQLTGGIAHDFNNMLAIVIGGLNLIRKRLERGGEDVGRLVDVALDGADRAATLTQRLLAFSRQQPLAPEPVDANRLVAGMSEILRRTLGGGIRLESVLAGGLWRTHADVSQLENALLNLAVNARDAMSGDQMAEDGHGARLTIETANAHLDDAYAAAAGIAPGQYVLVAVTDTGTGMGPDVLAKVFDPFFTTKPAGKGTGLGLSQVYGFVRQSGGHVKVYSEPGQGTSVKIYLPRFYGAGEPGSVTVPENPALPTGSRREVVLVVEDEEALRLVSVEALRELGYTVRHAESGAAALRVLDAQPGIALLFTDVVMPDMNGRRLAEEAMRRRPGLKVLYTTGFTRNAVVHNGVLDAGTNFLPKPFTLEQLAGKVRETLGGPP
jgi:signal transduction histidine kinase